MKRSFVLLILCLLVVSTALAAPFDSRTRRFTITTTTRAPIESGVSEPPGPLTPAAPPLTGISESPGHLTPAAIPGIRVVAERPYEDAETEIVKIGNSAANINETNGFFWLAAIYNYPEPAISEARVCFKTSGLLMTERPPRGYLNQLRASADFHFVYPRVNGAAGLKAALRIYRQVDGGADVHIASTSFPITYEDIMREADRTLIVNSPDGLSPGTYYAKAIVSAKARIGGVSLYQHVAKRVKLERVEVLY